MAILFNNVLMTRDAGSLLPSPRHTKLTISDCTINSVKIDRGFNEITKSGIGDPILPNPRNLPINATREDWSLNTELYAMFNGDLEEISSIFLTIRFPRTRLVIRFILNKESEYISPP